MLSVQIAAVVVRSRPWRIAYSAAVFAFAADIGGWYLTIVARSDRELLAQLMVVAVFLVAMVLVPGLIGARRTRRRRDLAGWRRSRLLTPERILGTVRL